MKRGQISSNVFVYILTVIIVIVILFFGYNYVTKSRDNISKTDIISLQNKISSDIETIGVDYGTFKKVSYSIKAGELCLFDLSKKEEILNSELINFYPFIKDSINSNTNKNAFFLNKKVFESFSVGDFEIKHYPYFKCLKPSSGKMNFGIEGLGNKALILFEFISKAKLSGEKIELKSTDDIITLVIPEGTSANTDEISIEIVEPDLIGKKKGSDIYKFEPSGTIFNNPIELKIKYNPSIIGVCPATLTFFQHHNDGTLKAKIPSKEIDCDAKVVTFEINGFSLGYLGFPDETLIYLNPDILIADIGDEVKLDIEVQKMTDLFFASLDINYNPQVLAYSRVTRGDFFSQENGKTELFVLESGNPGLVDNIIILRNQTPGIDGSGKLASIYFDVIGNGNSQITFKNHILAMSSQNQGELISEVTSFGSRVTVGQLEGECGNGNLDPGEVCDDGNKDDGDGCSSTCLVEVTPPNTIYLQPSAKFFNTGDKLKLDVLVSDIQDLMGIQFDINYDPNILAYTDSEEGTFLNQNNAQTIFLDTIDSTSPGLIKNIALVRVGNGVGGSGLLASIFFDVINSGNSDISLSEVLAGDSNGIPITVSTNPTNIIVSETEGECTFTNAYWNANNALENDIITLTVEGGGCLNELVDFVVKEYDLIGSDPVNVEPLSSSFIGNKATSTWTAEYLEDIAGDPEYYFIATLNSDNTKSIRSGTSTNDLLTVAKSSSTGPVLSLLPSAQVVRLGDQLKLDIRVSGMTDLFFAGLDISYNPDVLAFNRINRGTFFNQGGAKTELFVLESGNPGLVDNILILRSQTPGASGSGVIASIYFDTISLGNSDVSFDKFTLAMSSENQGNIISGVQTIKSNVNVVQIVIACGDGNIEGSEECDDGNVIPGDGCSSSCKLENVPRIEILSPQDGETIETSDVLVEFKTTDWEILGKGKSHIHFNIDDIPGLRFSDDLMFYNGQDKIVNLNLNSGETPYATRISNNKIKFNDVPNGVHKLIVRLVTASHQNLLNEEAKTTISFDVQNPSGFQCGDNIANLDEDCDGIDLDGMTCVDFDYSNNGDLSCNPDCQSFNISKCANDCGDGKVERSEECDDKNLINGDGCSSICSREPDYFCNNEPSICLIAPSNLSFSFEDLEIILHFSPSDYNKIKFYTRFDTDKFSESEINLLTNLPQDIIVYKAFNIKPANFFKDDVDKINVLFKVDGNWISQYNIDESTVALYHLIQNNWEFIPALKIKETINELHYLAVPKDFSTFVIGARSLFQEREEKIPPRTEPIPRDEIILGPEDEEETPDESYSDYEETDEIEETGKGKKIFYSIALFLLIVIIIVASIIFYNSKGKPPKAKPMTLQKMMPLSPQRRMPISRPTKKFGSKIPLKRSFKQSVRKKIESKFPSKKSIPSKNKVPSKKVNDYISGMRKEGSTDKEIKDSLIKVGWRKENIDKYFKK